MRRPIRGTRSPSTVRCRPGAVFHIPLFGYLLAALAMRTVRLALIGLPSVLIALSLLWSLWRQAGEDVAGHVEDDVAPHDAVGRA